MSTSDPQWTRPDCFKTVATAQPTDLSHDTLSDRNSSQPQKRISSLKTHTQQRPARKTQEVSHNEALELQAQDPKGNNNDGPDSSINNLRQLSFTQCRNIVPNNISHILSFVQREKRSRQIVQRIFDKYQHPKHFTLKAFYAYQQYLKNKIGIRGNYKTIEFITTNIDQHSQVFSIQEQLFYNKVCRILIDDYLSNYAAILTICSSKLKKTKRKDHLNVQRQLRNLWKGIEKE